MAKNRMNRSWWMPAGKRLEHHLLARWATRFEAALDHHGVGASAVKSRDLTPRDARLADRIDANAHRLAKIVGDLLDHASAMPA